MENIKTRVFRLWGVPEATIPVRSRFGTFRTLQILKAMVLMFSFVFLFFVFFHVFNVFLCLAWVWEGFS